MIRWLRVENFKNLVDVEAEFGPFNVMIGPNGCGKSSLLQAIDFLKAFFCSSVDVYLNEKGYSYSDLPNLKRSTKRIWWRLKAHLPPDGKGACGGEYEYTVSARKWRYLGVGEERLSYTPDSGETRVLIDRQGRKVMAFGQLAHEDMTIAASMPSSLMANLHPAFRQRLPEMFHFRDWIMSFRSYLIWDPKILRQRDRGKHTELGTSGEHLAPVLANLRRSQPQAYRRLLARLKQLFPILGDLSVKGDRGWGWKGVAMREQGGVGVEFNSQQMSDGLLRLLAVCTFLYAEPLPGVLMFEEPENGIHPQLIGETIQILREIALRKPHGCQIFMTTHSPYVLDEFFDTPEQVYVMERRGPIQGVAIHRLSDRRDVDVVQTLYNHSLGEAWYSGLIGGTAQGS